MRRPPEPHYTFTIPSVHDDTTLDCRVYHPDILSKATDNEGEQTWRKSGIVMAHPYAPMGGSYDDRVVGIVVDEFLNAGWIVGTFNFRGAQDSKGRTSWSGKPELDDYISFAAFFVHYMCYLHPCPSADTTYVPKQSPASSHTDHVAVPSRRQNNESPIITLGGYSYGSLILKHLPPLPAILQPFAAPMSGSAADEILLRARKLADQSNLEWINLARDEAQARRRHGRAHEPKPSLTMGGEETSPEKRRSSRDVRRSLEGGTSLKIRTRLRSLSHRRREDEHPVTPPEGQGAVSIVLPEVRYLLISPLTPPISTLAAPALGHKFWHKPQGGPQDVLGKHAALAVYGDQDMFTSAKKIRDWAEQLKTAPNSRLRSVEVAGAGHFWHEHGVEEQLRNALREWESDIR